MKSAILSIVLLLCLIAPSYVSSEVKIQAKKDCIESYFAHFESLAQSEKWNEILSQGAVALEAATKSRRTQEAALICAQLTSTAFYQGDYPQALTYANLCRKLSESVIDFSLLTRALYLESATHRALAGKNKELKTQQELYRQAIKTAQEAAHIYHSQAISDPKLKGKIFFNMGAAYADNPQGDLQKAVDCYLSALQCFKESEATQSAVRTQIRLAKAYLLQEKYTLTQELLDELRPEIKSQRIAMQADYLEAQLQLARQQVDQAKATAQRGLMRAVALGAKEDGQRLNALLQCIEAVPK